MRKEGREGERKGRRKREGKGRRKGERKQKKRERGRAGGKKNEKFLNFNRRNVNSCKNVLNFINIKEIQIKSTMS